MLTPVPHIVLFKDDSKRIVEKPFRLYDTAKGHSDLHSILRQQSSCSGEPVQLLPGVESTGGYEKNWLLALLKLCPSSHALAHAKVKRLCSIAYVSESKSEALIKAAQELAKPAASSFLRITLRACLHSLRL
ncbi:MAG: hypothetical protein JW795_11480 [Chitinivibrionales bacterium]|nr:hypothetical protein [Chitinivibrionales bacterium]